MRSKDFLPEKWSTKYKKSINCSNPRGFSQRAHCQGRKKTNESTGQKNEFITIMERLLPIIMKELDLDTLPKFKLVANVPDKDQPTFGRYVNDENLIWLAVENRHPIDIARTLAHELVHFKQDQDGRLDAHSGDTGSDIENEAHALAGVIMRHFNKKYPEHFSYSPVSLNESLGDRGDIPSGPGPQLIPFPKGTTMVDVSDVYDWYKLGMVISDLDDANPAIFGKGAPHTVIAFGSEEEEHKVLPLLKKLGLSVHDIDRPEDVKKVIPAKALVRDLAENFADGRNPQDKGDSKRYGINTKASVSSLRKTAKQGGRKGQLAHWLANMKAGRAKKK